MIKSILKNLFSNKEFSSLLSGSAITLGLKIAGLILGYVVMLYITNKYGAGVYGGYTIAVIVLNILVIFPRFGFANSLVRILAPLNRDNKPSQFTLVTIDAFKITLGLSILVSVLGYILKEYITSSITSKPVINNYDLLLLSIIPFSLFIVVIASFQAKKNSKAYMFYKFIAVNLFLFLVLLINSNFKFTDSLVELYFYAIVLAFVLGMFFFLRAVGINNFFTSLFRSKEIKEHTLKKIIKMSYPMLFAGTFMFLINWIDIFMLQYFKTEVEVGLYNVSQRIASFSTICLFAVNAVVTPKFAEQYTSNNMDALRRTVKYSTKLIFFTTTPILIVLIVFSKQILGLSGPEFILANMALIIMCLGLFINSISGSVGYIMQMTDNQKTFQNIIIIAAIMNFLLNYFLIPEYGINGAAISTTIAKVFANLSLVYIIRKRLGFYTIYIPFLKYK